MKVPGGGGVEALGIQDVKVYGIFWKFISGFRIEMIALVAGYVFSYQVNDLHRVYEFKSFVWKKFKRLLVPCWFFSIFYFFMFLFTPGMNLYKCFETIISGSGHLWFLPMLFWCFVSLWFIWRYRLSSFLLFVVLLFFSLVPPIPIGFGFDKFPHFIFYCYLGYCMWTHNVWLEEKFTKSWIILLLLVIYCVLFIINRCVFANLNFGENLIMRGIDYGINSISLFLLSIVGIFCMYLFVLRLVRNKNYVPSKTIIEASSLCYGIYVYHQFILKWLYLYSDLPAILGSYLLPWGALIITVGLSFVLTKLTLRFKFGQFLIG